MLPLCRLALICSLVACGSDDPTRRNQRAPDPEPPGPPEALDDAAEVLEGDATTVNVLSNDRFPAGPDLNSLRIVDPPVNGEVELLDSGSLRYHHTNVVSTADAFSYEVADPLGRTSTAVVTLEVLSCSACTGGVVDSDTDLGAYRRCALIDGDLSVARVSSLEDLACLRTMNGNLTIEDELDDLSGLRNLQHVDGFLTLVGPMGGLQGLESLATVLYGLQLRESDATTLAGATALEAIGSLTLESNGVLVSVEGLDGVPLGSLRAEDNPVLESLDGLALQAELYTVELIDNPGLRDLTGLAGVERIENLTLEGDGSLTDLSGLDALTFVGDIDIIANASFQSFSGAPNLAEVQNGRISNNPSLCRYDAMVWVQSVQSDSISVSNNLWPCP